MLENIACHVISSSYFKMIPEISKMRGFLAFNALVAETLSHVDTMRTAPIEQEDAAFRIGVCKTFQFMACLGSLPYFNSYWKYTPALVVGSLAIHYIHNHKKDSENKAYHPIVDNSVVVLNVVTKIVNSFAIGQLVHRTFYDAKPQGALMLAATVISVGISLSNIVYDWNNLSTLPWNR